MTDFLHSENTIFWPRKPGMRKILGDLEIAVMGKFWSRPPGTKLTVRAVFDAGTGDRKLAYTTIMTTVQRLADKGILGSDKGVYPHEYWAPLSREAFTRKAVGQLLDDLLADFAEPALAHLADRAGEASSDRAQTVVDELQRRRQAEES